ncbi:MAG: Na+/H+ antiporter NhaA [Actinomycetota bacterium]
MSSPDQSDADLPSRWPAIALLAALGLALLWVNVDSSSYTTLFQSQTSFNLGLPDVLSSVTDWTNSGLMTIFFLAIGLEVGHERRHGALADNKHALSPVVAALGGMAVAAGVFVLVALLGGGEATVLKGWGIPMATDVAFALGALQLLGARVPSTLRAFVLALAVADDIFSVIALGFTGSTSIELIWTLFGIGVVLLVIVMRTRVFSRWPYVAATAALWWLMARSGIEPILAGAIVGVLVPTGDDRSKPSTSTSLLRPVAGISNAVVLPLFVLANAGIALNVSPLSHGAPLTTFIGLMLARTLGKVLGIGGSVALLQLLHLGGLPRGVSLRQLIGAAALCGVGFTVPLLYASLAFSGRGDLLAATKLGLLLASLVGFLLGVLIIVGRPNRR